MGTAPRAFGPYRERNGWRVILAEEGKRSTRRFRGEEEARCFVAGYGEEGLTVKEAIEAYEVHMRAKGLKPRTVVVTEQRLRKLMTPVLDKPLTRLTQARCAALYSELAAAVSVDTHRNCLIYARTWGRWLRKERTWTTNPWEDVEGFGLRSKGKPQLRVDEARKWMEEAVWLASRGNQGAVAALLAAVMGMRAGEVLGLRCRDVDDDARLLWVDGTKTDAARRVLEVPELLRGVLQREAHGRDGGERLFEATSTAWLRQWVKRICGRAGVQEVTSHGMRGLHATLAMAAGSIAHVVAEQLGHTSPIVTMKHYANAKAVAAASAKRVELKLVGNGVGNERATAK